MPYVPATVRRKQIVLAALAVLARDGVAKMTLRAVAAEAAIPLSTMQHVFDSKEGLMHAVTEEVMAEIGAINTTAYLEGGDLATQIRHATDIYWENYVSKRPLMQAAKFELSLNAMRDPKTVGLARWRQEQFANMTAEFFTAMSARAGEELATPAQTLANVAIAMMDGLCLHYAIDPDPDRAREELEITKALVCQLATGKPATLPVPADA